MVHNSNIEKLTMKCDEMTYVHAKLSLCITGLNRINNSIRQCVIRANCKTISFWLISLTSASKSRWSELYYNRSESHYGVVRELMRKMKHFKDFENDVLSKSRTISVLITTFCKNWIISQVQSFVLWAVWLRRDLIEKLAYLAGQGAHGDIAET